MILGAIKDQLLATEGVTDLVEDRIYVDYLPQDDLRDAIDMRISASRSNQDLAGEVGLFQSIVTIDCLSMDKLQADQIAMAVINSDLQMMHGTYSGKKLRGGILRGGISHDQQGVSPGSDRWQYVSSVSYEFSWLK